MAKIPNKAAPKKRGVTARKQDAALLTHALEAARIAVAEIDLKSRLIAWSKNTSSILGLRPSQLPNHLDDFLLLVHTEDRTTLSRRIKSLVERNKSFQLEYKIAIKNNIAWMVSSGALSNKGRTLAMTFQDVTSRKVIESELANWKIRHEMVTESAGLIIYDYTIETGDILWTGDLENVVGFTNRQMGRIEKWGELIHPDDREQAYNLLEKAQLNLEPYDVNYRFKTLKKGYRYMHDRGSFIGDATGKAIRMLGMMNDVSEKMLRDLEAKENDKKFRKLMEDINVGIILHGPDAAIRLVNRAALNILGTGETDLKGRTTFESFFEIIREDGTPFPDHELPALMAIRLGKSVRNTVMGIIRPHSKERVWVLVNAEPTLLSQDNLQSVVVTVTDITERKKMEQALKESELRFRTLQKASFGGIGLHRQGQIIDCNQGLCDVTGYSYEELIGRNGITLVAPEFQEEVISKIRSDFDKPYDVVGIRKDGSRYALEIQGKNIPYNDGTTIRVTEFRDITERKMSEAQILEQNAKLVAITQDMQVKNDQLQEFAQIVSHNLRSPVGNILSLLTLIDSAETDAEKDEYISLLKESGTSTLTTLNELNEVLQIKQDKDIERQELVFGDVCENVTRMLNARVAQADARIVMDFEEAPTVMYPNIYLESILLNLLSNALKYAHPERTPLIKLKSFFSEGQLCLSVSDNGLGINMEKYGHQIFKLRKTFHRHPESRGIGLFMIKNQIVAMGGDITVSSVENEGSTFTITFTERPLP